MQNIGQRLANIRKVPAIDGAYDFAVLVEDDHLHRLRSCIDAESIPHVPLHRVGCPPYASLRLIIGETPRGLRCIYLEGIGRSA